MSEVAIPSYRLGADFEPDESGDGDVIRVYLFHGSDEPNSVCDNGNFCYFDLTLDTLVERLISDCTAGGRLHVEHVPPIRRLVVALKAAAMRLDCEVCIAMDGAAA